VFDMSKKDKEKIRDDMRAKKWLLIQKLEREGKTTEAELLKIELELEEEN